MSTLQSIEQGLEPADVAMLVDRFYEKIRRHPTLGPVFNAVVQDWDVHQRRLTSFWCSVALREASYHGNPMARHQPLPINVTHFQQWLVLWRDTAREVLQPGPAERMIDYAERIGNGLQAGLGLRPRAQPLGLPVATART